MYDVSNFHKIYMKKILSSASIQIVGKISTAIISIIFLKILSSYLGVKGFGYYSTIYEFLAFFAILADFGIYTLAVRDMSQVAEKERNYIFGNIIGLRFIITFIALLFALLVVFLIPQYHNTPIPLGVLLASFGVFVALMSGTLTSALQVHYKMKYATLSQVTGKIANLLWILILVFFLQKSFFNTQEISSLFTWSFHGNEWWNIAIYAAIFGGVIGNVIQCIITIIYTKKYQKISCSFEKKFFKQFIKKILPYGIALFCATAYFKIDTLLLSLLKGAEYVGIYAVAMRIIETASFLPLFYLNSLLPELTKSIQKKQHTEVHMLLQKSFQILFSTSVFLVFLTFIFSKSLVILVASPDFLSGNILSVGSEKAIQISIWMLLFSFINYLYVYTIIAYDKQKVLLLVNGMGLLLAILLNYIFIPLYGIVAAATTTVCLEIFIMIANFYILHNISQFNFPWKIASKILSIGIITFLPLFMIWSHVSQTFLFMFLSVLLFGGLYIYFILKYIFHIPIMNIFKK
jgi:O-antigen/teichoic acid export membrane protein